MMNLETSISRGRAMLLALYGRQTTIDMCMAYIKRVELADVIHGATKGNRGNF